MKLVTIIALGDKKWAEFALNCCLSIKAHDFNQKVGLITDGICCQDIQSDIDRFFDYQTIVQYKEVENPIEKAFYTKVNLYELATQMCGDADEFINIDADCLMIPSNGISELFEENKERIFSAYCNDVFDFKTNSSKRGDYTFWCNPLEAQEYFGLVNPLPQLNTSFIYFSKCPLVSNLFRTARRVWHDDYFNFNKYKDCKPDELCFNIACSITNVQPHTSPYRPIFMQFASENQHEVYIQHQYKALGFAGERRPSDNFVSLYNKYVDYYRHLFGITGFVVETETQTVSDIQEIILPCIKRTIFRSGELENSDAGVFNPDGIVLPDGNLLTILRKEKNFDAYKQYGHGTAIAHLLIQSKSAVHSAEVNVPYIDKARREDFRLFEWNGKIYTNYTKIEYGRTFICYSEVSPMGGFIQLEKEVVLPISVNAIEKNWAFFSIDKHLYCVYSISPYKIFYTVNSCSDWYRCDGVDEVKIDFFHKSHICNSTNPILVDDHYLMWFHTKERGIYYHGAVLFNKDTLQIEYSTKNPIQMKPYADGFQKGLIYVSGCIYLEETNSIRVFYGEGDSHACYSDFDKDVLFNAIKGQIKVSDLRNTLPFVNGNIGKFSRLLLLVRNWMSTLRLNKK